MKKWFFFLSLLSACSTSKMNTKDDLCCIQIIDRNGVSETIGMEERLASYQKMDFHHPQPYRQVLRIFHKDEEGKSGFKLTSYHTNGQLWQYLEGKDTRAYGNYLEWHPNGTLKIEAFVIEGPADLTVAAQKDWLFDGVCRVWDEEGKKTAQIPYAMGFLEGVSIHYYPSGQISKTVPYIKDEIQGEVCLFRESGGLFSKTFYEKGKKHGPSLGYWENEASSFIENYEEGSLITGLYWDSQGEKIAEVQNGEGIKACVEEGGGLMLVEIQNGKQEGKVQVFTKEGELSRLYHVKQGKMQGEEIYYFLARDTKALTPTGSPLAKLLLTWDTDLLQGTIKSWYPNGRLESQKEMHRNKKNGTNCAWYEEGSLMFVEEYEQDKLIQGSYFKPKDSEPVSKITLGNGEATLFDGKNGKFLRKIIYINGRPQE